MVETMARQVDERWKTFGAWVYEIRRRRDMTQSEAARAADLTPTQWWRIENGESGTKFETIPRIAAALSTSVMETFHRAGFVSPKMDETYFPDGLPPLMQEDMDKVIEYAKLLYGKQKANGQ